MSEIQSAPISEPLADQSGRARKAWVFFFNQLSDGDQGTLWTPVATGITGSPEYDGKYFKNAGFIDFWITIDPVTTTSSTLGSSYIELPFDVTVATPCAVAYGSTVAFGIIDPSTNRCFLPTWSGVTGVVTISGRVFNK